MKTIAVDFDGVIHKYSKGWKDGSIYDDPMPGAQEYLQRLIDAGYRIIIYTTRAFDRVVGGKLEKNQCQELTEWLIKHGIPYHEIWTEPGKPLCHLFIDDRAMRFEFWNDSELAKIVTLAK